MDIYKERKDSERDFVLSFRKVAGDSFDYYDFLEILDSAVLSELRPKA